MSLGGAAWRYVGNEVMLRGAWRCFAASEAGRWRQRLGGQGSCVEITAGMDYTGRHQFDGSRLFLAARLLAGRLTKQAKGKNEVTT